MKVLIAHGSPFFLAHGGFGIQIERTLEALREIGIDVDYMRWWDNDSKPDIIHYFGRPSSKLIEMCHIKRIRFVMLDLLSGQGSRSLFRLRIEGLRNRFLQSAIPKLYHNALPALAYQHTDALMTNTAWEAKLMQLLYSADPSKMYVIPNGVESIFFNEEQPEKQKRATTSKYLVCTATIHPRKRVLEMAEAAIIAKVPVWIIGKPYSEYDEYYRRFLEIHKLHPDLIRYEGAVEDRRRLAEIYKEAPGFILLSAMETRSLSSEEAAAAKCPLLLSDLPWARDVFGGQAAYCPISNIEMTANHLKNFYNTISTQPTPPKPKTWRDVALMMKSVYELVLDRACPQPLERD